VTALLWRARRLGVWRRARLRSEQRASPRSGSCEVLAALLPGFRDVRSALVAGYMWVAAAWLFLAYLWPDLADLDERSFRAASEAVCNAWDSGIARCTQRAVSARWRVCKRNSAIDVLSTEPIVCRRLTPANRADVRRSWLRLFRHMSTRAIARVFATARRARSSLHVEPTEHPNSESTMAAELAAISVLREVLFLSPRLIVAKPEFYAEFDRVRAERAFRDAVLLPFRYSQPAFY
jgi:hypothetical protein